MKKLALVLFFAATTLSVIAQELTVTKYYNKNGDGTGKDNASDYSVITYTDATKEFYTTKYYTIDGHLKTEIRPQKRIARSWLLPGPFF